MRPIDADNIPYTMIYKENWATGTGVEALGVWKDDIDRMPPIEITPVIQVAPMKHGKWIIDRWQTRVDKHICSVCRHLAEIIEVDGRLVGCNDPSGETGGYYQIDTDVFLPPYCPYCGAQMENPSEDILNEDECDE